jgi:hypothetical protein
MAVRGDEIADRVEAKIREAVNRMVQEIHTSIHDVREQMEQQLQAALQSVQADVNALSFRSHLDDGIREIEDSYRQAAPPPPTRADAESIKQSVRNIEAGQNQVGVLSALLEECLRYGSRAALLILKGDSFSGWKGAGFSAHGGNDEAVKRFSATRDSLPQFDQLLRNQRTIIWDGQNLSSRFGVRSSTHAALIPMVIKDKVAAAVYVDATADAVERFDQSAIELLVFATGLLVDTLAIRKTVPSPTLSDAANVAPIARPAAQSAGPSETVAVRSGSFGRPTPPMPAPVAPPPPPPEPEPEEEPAAEEAAPTPATESPAPEPPPAVEQEAVSEPEPEPELESEPEPQPQPPQYPVVEEPRQPSRSFQLDTAPPADRFRTAEPEPRSDFATAMFPMMKQADSSSAQIEEEADEERAAPPRSPAVPSPTSAAELAERPSTQYIPPPGLARGGAFAQKSDDERKHEEARRFARLLVSEIKLYNESQVEQGRRDKDIYERLKEDIDRSRQMYDDRIADDVRKGTNYFYEELVRILADGNTEALGM